MPSSKVVAATKQNLINMLDTLQTPITKEINEQKLWGFAVARGPYNVFIANNSEYEFMIVEFRVNFDNKSLDHISRIKNNEPEWLKFIWSLRSIISTPSTGFGIFVDDDQNLTGFSISVNIFPFSKGFTLKELNDAIQAVVSVGAGGLDYVAGTMGAMEIQQNLSDIPPSPEGMYR